MIFYEKDRRMSNLNDKISDVDETDTSENFYTDGSKNILTHFKTSNSRESKITDMPYKLDDDLYLPHVDEDIELGKIKIAYHPKFSKMAQ